MVLTIAYGAGSAALLVLLVLILLGGRPEGVGRYVVVACAITLAWSGACALDIWRLAGLAQILEDGRSAAWLFFLGALLETATRSQSTSGLRHLRALALGLGAVAIGNDVRFAGTVADLIDFDFTQVLARVALAVAGILLVENLYRNAGEERRWHVVPLCIGLGAMFAYDLFLYSDALLFRRVDGALFAARGVVIALIVPSLVLTMVRNRDWRIDVHVSRQMVFHTATLMASGIFLLAAAGAALLLRRLPGDWGALLQAVTLFGSILVLLTVLSSGTVRSRIKMLLVQNLFSHRYDYRVEWMKFVETVSGSDDVDALPVRVIRAIADIVDSPGGALWLRGESGAFRPRHEWNLHFRPDSYQPEASPFVAGFERGTAIQQLRDGRGPGDIDGLPEWAGQELEVWLAVPLWHRDALLGFATLAPPRAPFVLDWESRDLLLAVGKQAASYLSEEQVARALVDAKLLTEYGRRFAFVVHDIKNLVSQLTMTVTNARAHGDDPEFQKDMLVTLENSVSRMTDLLSKLRAGDSSGEDPASPLDARGIISGVADEVGRHRVKVLTELTEERARVAIKPNALRSVITHLITNAVEASPDDGLVTVRSRVAGGRLVIDVEDRGPGMDATFVREQLFKPFSSTKSTGHGIGAFQTRETIREAGGDLQVVSSPGKGTTMRIVLPCLAEERVDGRPVVATADG
jgi:putative PEP-CTERM system histidine kinase